MISHLCSNSMMAGKQQLVNRFDFGFFKFHLLQSTDSTYRWRHQTLTTSPWIPPRNSQQKEQISSTKFEKQKTYTLIQKGFKNSRVARLWISWWHTQYISTWFMINTCYQPLCTLGSNFAKWFIVSVDAGWCCGLPVLFSLSHLWGVCHKKTALCAMTS